jgi:hypothetical protein
MKTEITAKELGYLQRRRAADNAREGRQKLAGPKLETRANLKADRGRVRDNPYLAYLRRQPCESCGSTERVQAAHIRCGYADAGWPPTGMQVKPSDARALSLCVLCHLDGPDAQHKSNERSWWAARNIYPPTRCAEVYADFEAGRDQERRAA